MTHVHVVRVKSIRIAVVSSLFYRSKNRYENVPEGILFDEISGFAPEIINGNLDLVK